MDLLRLSPSRASDFKACPQLYKFRAVDRIPEPEDPYSALGSLVHATLERLLAFPAEARTLEKASELIQLAWEEVRDAQLSLIPAINALDEEELIAHGKRLLENYFLIEDPASIKAHELEWWVEHEAEKVMLRGIVDRVETLPDGEWVLSDYKTGSSPSERATFGSFFGLRFYALVCWRAFGKMPKELRLINLKKPEVIRLVPTPQMLEGLERQLEAIGAAIRRAFATGDWRPRPGPLCNWCSHRAICPAWGDLENDTLVSESVPIAATAGS